MLVSRIHHSMNLVAEGVEKCDSFLITEATKEFETATAELKKNIESFVSVGKEFKPLEDFFGMVSSYGEMLDEIDFDDISDEYSFSDHYEMLTAKQKEDGKVNPEFDVSRAATEYPTYVNALRNGIMAIAEWAEKFPEVFSVGKNGIIFADKFRGLIEQGNPDIKVQEFCDEK